MGRRLVDRSRCPAKLMAGGLALVVSGGNQLVALPGSFVLRTRELRGHMTN